MNAKQSRAIIAEVKQSPHRFTPHLGLPVVIDYTDRTNPFKLSAKVVYRNGPLKVVIPKGFKCDATSTPAIVFGVPAAINVSAASLWMLAHHLSDHAPTVLADWLRNSGNVLWIIAAALSAILPLAMPAVGQLGIHARATTVHDVLYRTQTVSRVVADAVMLEIMLYDRVPWLARTVMYYLLRMFGGRAWRNNAAILAAGESITPPGEPEPTSEVSENN